MAYQLLLEPSAQKDLKRIPERDQGRIMGAIAGLVQEPFSGKKMKGEYQGFYSLRVWPYRIIYAVLKKQLIIAIIQIGQRGDIY